jgi:protein YIPF6
VCDSVMRDLRRVGSKLLVVLDPRRLLKFRHTEEEIVRNNEIVRRELRNWDLWGPLIICTVLGIVQSSSAPAEQTSLVFASVFFIVWGGGAVLTLNAQLLGTPLSFFQSICLLGYSIFPLALAAILSLLSKSTAFRLPLLIVANAWCLRASALFLASVSKQERRALVLYPVFLFYFVLTWMVFLE